MTSYDQAFQECEMEYRPVAIIVFKAGLCILIRVENA